MTYTDFRTLMGELTSQNKSTGEDQSETRVSFSILNHQRMKRLDKKGKISDKHIETIKNLNTPIKWTALTESWCGDAAQILPYLNKIALLNDNIELEILLRDENLELMDAHLTNGGRAIPKIIATDVKSNTFITDYGPRPSIATKMVNDFKTAHGTVTPELKKDLQIWYTKNKGENIVDDILANFF